MAASVAFVLENKVKVIYTNTTPKNQQPNVCYRTSFLGVISAATSVEVDDEFPNAEAVKQAYAFLDAQPLSVQVEVGITPELQAVVDEAKAECEKVVEENTALKAQIEALSANESAKSELESDNSRLKDSVLILENAQKESLEQLQAAKGEFIAFQNNIDAMKARITELEANADKTDDEKPKTTKAK